MESREGADTRDMIGRHWIERLINLRGDINGLNVGNREWLGTSSTNRGVAASQPVPGLGKRQTRYMLSAETIFFVESRRKLPKDGSTAESQHPPVG